MRVLFDFLEVLYPAAEDLFPKTPIAGVRCIGRNKADTALTIDGYFIGDRAHYARVDLADTKTLPFYSLEMDSFANFPFTKAVVQVRDSSAPGEEMFITMRTAADLVLTSYAFHTNRKNSSELRPYFEVYKLHPRFDSHDNIKPRIRSTFDLAQRHGLDVGCTLFEQSPLSPYKRSITFGIDYGEDKKANHLLINVCRKGGLWNLSSKNYLTPTETEFVDTRLANYRGTSLMHFKYLINEISFVDGQHAKNIQEPFRFDDPIALLVGSVFPSESRKNVLISLNNLE